MNNGLIEKLVCDSARKAGTHVRENAFNIGDLDFKSKNDPVTNLDREAEKIIIAEFEPYGFNHIGEEFKEIDRGHRYTELSDPIDGTKSFTHSDFNSSTAVMVFDEEEQVPVVSAVYDFMRDIMYFANDKGAFVQHGLDSPKIALPREFPAYTVNRTLSTQPKQAPKWMKQEPFHIYQQRGSYALALAQVATGSYDAFFSPQFNKAGQELHGRHDIGDVIGGAHMLKKAGYIVTDADGGELDYNTMANGLMAVRQGL